MMGLTLLELILAVSIAGILIVVGVPSFIQLYQEHHLKTTVQNLYYVLQYARSEAIKNNTTVYAVFTPGANWCYGIRAGASCTCSLANSCTLGNYSAPSAQDSSLAVTGMSSNSIQFDGTHAATNTSSTIIFTLYGQSTNFGVKVSAMGNIQLCSSNLSGYPTCS